MLSLLLFFFLKTPYPRLPSILSLFDFQPPVTQMIAFCWKFGGQVQGKISLFSPLNLYSEEVIKWKCVVSDVPFYLPVCSETTKAHSVLPRQDQIIITPHLITYLKALLLFLFFSVCCHLPIVKCCNIMDFFHRQTMMGVGTLLPWRC